jgi:prepilin peptidase CpaA
VLGFIAFACMGVSIVLLLGAALHDAATRTIPNAIPVGLAGIGFVQRLCDGQLLMSMMVAAILFVLLSVLWLRGFVGGGDVKLISAASMAFPSSSVPSFLLAVAIAGGILALSYLALSTVTPRPRAGPRVGLLSRLAKAELWRLNRRGPLPYAIAISAGALLMIGKSFSG